MNLYLFNPDADLALAHPQSNYIAPAAVRQMAADLALLPVWYAEPQSRILAPSAFHADFLQAMQQQFDLPVGLLTEPELCELPDDTRIVPWGWTPVLRARLLQGGIPEKLLPSPGQLETLRARASRRWTGLWLRMLNKEETDAYCGASDNLLTLEQCRAYVEARPHATLLKAPWSGSGKGLRWCREGFTPAIEGWCRRILNEQGGVTASPIYNKVEDCAMEFRTDGRGGVTFIGYSLFSTHAGGAYQENRLMPEREAEARLSSLLSPALLERTRNRLLRLLSFYARSHEGYVGVDMMVCRDDRSGKLLLHPCVEVNMRMTMGMVALLFNRRYLSPGVQARFYIDYRPASSLLQAVHRERMQLHPPLIEEGRLRSGCLPLVPLKPDSRYMAYVETK